MCTIMASTRFMLYMAKSPLYKQRTPMDVVTWTQGRRTSALRDRSIIGRQLYLQQVQLLLLPSHAPQLLHNPAQGHTSLIRLLAVKALE